MDTMQSERPWTQMGQSILQLTQVITSDSRLLPFAFAYISFIWQVVVGFLQARHLHRSGALTSANDQVPGPSTMHLIARFNAYVRTYGGYGIFGSMVARFVGTLSLLCLSVMTPVRNCQYIPELGLCLEESFTIVMILSSFMGIVSLTSKVFGDRATKHNILLLLFTLGVYVYRDIWPLATYSLEPEDRADGNILWAKISVLAVTAVIIPLFTPNAYIPTDPEHPMPIPGRELVDSWISRLTYIYIDPIIVLANKVSHLSFDQLPPLLDVDYASYLTQEAFQYLDPFLGAKRRHLFWGLLYHFRWEFFVGGFCLIGSGICTFAAPVGINMILSYLETNGENATIKPWLWIALFFVGAFSKAVMDHWYLYLLTVIIVRVQAILTQLLFEHSLRIRLKAEASGDKPSSQVATPTTPSITEEEFNGESSTLAGSASDFDHAARNDNETQTSSTMASSLQASEATLKGSIKGKAKAGVDSKGAVPRETAKKYTGDAENLLGRINNLVSSDLDAILDGADFLTFVIFLPLQITLSIIFLSAVLGWSAFISILVTFGLSPIAGFIAKKMQTLQTTKMKMSDARIQNISEAIGVIRMVKLFGWEAKMSKKVEEEREEELRWSWKVKALGVLNSGVSNLVPTLAMFATYATYTVVMKKELNASKIFSSMSVFSILRNQLGRLVWQANLMIQAKVSLDRITKFLGETELLDQFVDKQERSIDINLPADEESHDIGFRNATFAWSAEQGDGSLTPSSRNFMLHVEGEVLFKRNCINMIVGPTGSGKTSILMALLGEMHFIPSQADSWFNLPRGGGVAYAAQESWVQSATIQENILFGTPYDEERYKKVICQCALERDLELFDAGDKTEVGERGLTLSGGQKARVTIARAIYSNAEILLLDDILAALDVHTSAWIINKCFCGDLVKGRTILLVTHNIALVGPIAEFVVSLSLDGSIQTQGTDVSSLLGNYPLPTSEVEEEEKKALEDIKEETEPAPKAKSDGKLIMAEEIVEGHVTWKSITLLISALGGNYPGPFFALLVGWMVTGSILVTTQTWFLGAWGSQYENHAPSDVRLSFYLTVFSLIILGHFVVVMSLQFFFNYRTVSASRVIHSKLVDSIFRSTFRWLDETPTARIITRCTQDIRVVDTSVPFTMFVVIDLCLACFIKLGAIVLFTPIFIFPGIIVGICGTLLGNWYLKAQLSIKREMSNARAPLLSYFNAAIHGLVSIRAYGAQQALRQESFKRIDHYTRIARTSWNVNRWIGLRMDILGALFITLLAYHQVYVQPVSAATTGFSLNMAVSFCMFIFSLIRLYNNFEVECNSLERIQMYLDIDREPKSTETAKPPASWPTSGDLRVENLSARYSQSGPTVLHNLSFHINSGERIGVVGRTGSGKSSLTLALLRCIITEGTVYYDGIPTKEINLDALRSNITIIPQTPELLSGTLRQNLDPFEQSDDATLNDALRAAGLFSLQEETEARLSLDSKIAGGGANLSVGQRQIIALVRAMVRGSKLLILDEATSAIDYKTDAMIQRSLRSELGPDVTVITVAHRLQTIMDADKIMVLDNGNIIEFDSPKILLKKEDGALRALIDGSGDKDALYELAEGSR